MALDLAGLKVDIKALYDATIGGSDDGPTAEANFCNGLAEAIDTYVRSASINYSGGLVAGTTPVTGTLEADLA